MKLFFESSGQANVFLLMSFSGFVIALLLDSKSSSGVIRLMVDALIIIWGGVTLLATVVFFRENTLRAYHLLGMLSGVLIYLAGVGKIIRRLRLRQEHARSTANLNDSEMLKGR